MFCILYADATNIKEASIIHFVIHGRHGEVSLELRNTEALKSENMVPSPDCHIFAE
jgi:hypothetical protein